MTDLAVVAAYPPPKDGLPHLAVAITPDGKVHGLAVNTAAEAQALADDILAELAKVIAKRKN